MSKPSIARACVLLAVMWAACSKDRPITGPPPSPPPPPLAPSRLVFRVQPTDGVISAALRPIEVALVDSAGTVVPLDSLPITILLSIDSVGATLSGTKTVPTHRGIAVFNDLSLDRAGWSFRLGATPPPGMGGQLSGTGMSDPFKVLYPPGTHLAFRTQPTQAMAAVPISPVEVVILDSANHDMSRVVTWVSIVLRGGEWFSGSVAALTVGGVARFTDLSFAGPASGLTLNVFTFGLQNVSSNSFSVAARRAFTGSAVAAGAASSCALDTQGAAWCWGDNLVGQLGDGRDISIPRPNPVAGDITFYDISMTKQSWLGTVSDPARSIACGTSRAGVLYCWGGGAKPFNGIGASTPKQFGTNFRMVEVGHEYACGLESGGVVQCWGYRTPLGFYGGRTAGDKIFTQLTTGGDHMCALTAAGAAFCWLQYQESPTPTAVPGSHVFQTITAGDAHTCGLDNDGVAWCWGWRYAPLGDSLPATGTGAPDPVRVKTDQRFAAISAGEQFTCALAADRRAWCWGNNWSGALGDGTTAPRLVPTAVSGGHVFLAISAGGRHTCAITTTRELWCWGANGGGQLGNGTWREFHTPVRVLGDDAFVTVSAGGDATCGVTTTGAGRCWGDNTGGELGDGHPLMRPVPGRVLGGHTFTSITAGDQLACGLTAFSETWCWGYVADSVEKTPIPLRLSADPGFRLISVGTHHGCGIDRDGAGWCWGRATLGNGSKDSSVVPVRISGGLTLDAISVGDHACALTTSGDAYCWGPRTATPGTDFSIPQLVPGGLKFVALSGGGDHDCGLTASGDAYCWGRNFYGGLGDGTSNDSPTPRLVVGGLHFTSISVGYGLTCGITAEKQAYCWRDDPNNAGWARPTLVVSPRFESIDVSRSYSAHACGVATAGALYCWGANRSGQLGIGATNYDYEPTAKLVVGGLLAAPPH